MITELLPNKVSQMSSDPELYRIAFRVNDKQFVVRDRLDNDVFAGNYSQVESWLDQRENSLQPAMAAEDGFDSETEIAADVFKATILTQEMIDKALSSDPKPTSLRGRLFGKREKTKK